MRYLANKYGRDDLLYPREPQKRALVDQALDFDMNTFYQPFVDYWVSSTLILIIQIVAFKSNETIAIVTWAMLCECSYGSQGSSHNEDTSFDLKYIKMIRQWP